MSLLTFCYLHVHANNETPVFEAGAKTNQGSFFCFFFLKNTKIPRVLKSDTNTEKCLLLQRALCQHSSPNGSHSHLHSTNDPNLATTH